MKKRNKTWYTYLQFYYIYIIKLYLGIPGLAKNLKSIAKTGSIHSKRFSLSVAITGQLIGAFRFYG